MNTKIKNFFKDLYHKLVGINDSPHRKAGGFAVGVFTGLLPAMGPVAAIFIATLFRVNRAAAFAGSLVTNTWISLITLVFAIKLGSYLTGEDWQDHYDKIKEIFKNFKIAKLFDASNFEILKPMFIGYFIIGIIFAVVAYIVSYFVIIFYQKKKEGKKRG